MEKVDQTDGKSWGVRYNHSTLYHRKKSDVPEGCPSWARSIDIDHWDSKGVVIWNNATQKMEMLSGGEAIALLNKLKTTSQWKTEGISITRRVYQVSLDNPKKSTKKKTKEIQESEVENNKSSPNSGWIDQETLRLPADAGDGLINFLQSKENELIQMAEVEDKLARETWMKVVDLLIKFSRDQEVSEVDFSHRPFKWETPSKDNRWICHDGSNRGVVYLSDHKLFWNACVEFQGHYWQSKYDFTELQNAVQWVEEELATLRNKSNDKVDSDPKTKEEREKDRARIRQKLADSPFWIDPTQLEPEQVTFQIVIDLFYLPYEYKVGETVFGETYHYDQRYPPLIKLATELNLDPDQFKIERPFGETGEWYQFLSLVSYYQDTLAASQAQNAWDHSTIVQHFKSGKISRARYGYQEIETGYPIYLGGCDAPEQQPWGKPTTRAKYLVEKALRESIFYSLDVDDFRDYLGISPEIMDDDGVIRQMHEAWAESKSIPIEARKESQLWLVEHSQTNPHPNIGKRS
jgi:hypothetical protein